MKEILVTVENFYVDHSKALDLALVAGAAGLKRRIHEPTVNRPGLLFSGFTRYFANQRVQAIGNAEYFYLKSLNHRAREACFRAFVGYRIPCVVFSRNLKPDKVFVRLAEEADIPVFRSSMITMNFLNRATLALEAMFAPRDTVIGSMVDVHGIGVIIKGESGIGKSESVLNLIERGYSLVADDATRVVLLDGREVMGSGAAVTRDHMEVRGIGIINVAAMFGARSIRREKRVDLVVSLKPWEEVPDVDRLGMEQEFVEILGIRIPHMTIPVRPGRDLARLIEVAAFHTQLCAAGHNAAKELDTRVAAAMKGA